MPQLPSITSKAFPALTKALLKFSITILFTAPPVLLRQWLIRLLTAVAIQSACKIEILLSFTKRLPLLLHILRPILAATIRFLAC
jgi:hypothetical protein